MARRRVVLQLLSAFAVIGPCSARQVYSVVSMPSRSAQEIGVRLALGASRRSIVAMVSATAWDTRHRSAPAWPRPASRHAPWTVFDVSTTDH
jgi:hypothetical protein